MGDFNAVPDSDEIRWLTGHDDARRPAGRVPGRLGARERGRQRRTDLAASPGPARTPTSSCMHWLRPDRRLDYIFVTPVRRDRRATVHGAWVVFDEPGERPRASACSCRTTSASSRTCRWWRSRRMRRPERGGMFLLAHVTDPHFRGFAGASPTDFMNKRALGTLNLLFNRTRKHKMQLLEALRLDMRAQAPDHLALTGDFANVSLPGEWRAALAWIDTCGLEPAAISVIPGNHDAYIEEVVASRAFEKLFAPYMTARSGAARGCGRRADYPYVQIRDGIAFVGVSSSVATGDSGRLGPDRRRAARAARGDARGARAGGQDARRADPPSARAPEAWGGAQPPRPRRAGGGAGARRGGPGAARSRSPGRTHRARRPGRETDPDHRRRLGVVHGQRPSAARATTSTRSRAASITWVTRAHDEASDTFKEVRARTARLARWPLREASGSACSRLPSPRDAGRG